MTLLPPLPPTFEAALRDVDAQRGEFRLAAATRLGSAGDPDERRRAVGALARACRDPLAPVREAALRSVGLLAAAELLSAAEDGLADPHPGVRDAAAVALGRIGGERALALLAAAAHDARPAVRGSAILGLGCIADPEASERIAPLAADPEPTVRVLAVEALGERGDGAHTDTVARRLGDADPAVVEAAARALGQLGDRRAIPTLRALLGDREARFEAVELLGRLEAVEARDDLARLASRRLGSLLVRAAAGGALARMGDPRGVVALRAVLRAVRADGRGLAVELVGTLRLTELRPDLERLARRPRGVDLETVRLALARLAADATDNRTPSSPEPAGGALLPWRTHRNEAR